MLICNRIGYNVEENADEYNEERGKRTSFLAIQSDESS